MLLHISDTTFCDTAPACFCKPASQHNCARCPLAPRLAPCSCSKAARPSVSLGFHASCPTCLPFLSPHYLTPRGPSRASKLPPSPARPPTLSLSLNAFLGFSYLNILQVRVNFFFFLVIKDNLLPLKIFKKSTGSKVLK